MPKIERTVILPRTRAATKGTIELMSGTIENIIKREKAGYKVEKGVSEKDITLKPNCVQVVILFLTMTTNALNLKRKIKRILNKGIGVYVVSMMPSERPEFQKIEQVASGTVDFPPDPRELVNDLRVLFWKLAAKKRLKDEDEIFYEISEKFGPM